MEGINLIVTQEYDRNKLLDVNVFKCVGGGISSPHVVVAKIRWLRWWPGIVVEMEERYKIKGSELSKETWKTGY